MTSPDTHPAERETPAGEAMREAVAPSAAALKVAEREGGAAGVLIERIAWALEPVAFAIWEREHERKPKGSGPTYDQLAVADRRRAARATASMLVAGPVASELARLTAELDEARATNRNLHRRLQTAEGQTLARAVKAERAAEFWFRRRKEGSRRIYEHASRRVAAEAALTTLRADHAAEVVRKDEEIAALSAALKPFAQDANLYDDEGPPIRKYHADDAGFRSDCASIGDLRRARAALATTETTDA